MLRDARTALDFHRAPSEGIIRGLARPYISFTGTEMAHLVGGQLAKCGVRLLDVFQPSKEKGGEPVIRPEIEQQLFYNPEAENLADMFEEDASQKEESNINQEPISSEDIDALLNDDPEHKGNNALTPERIKKAWDKLSGTEKKFILIAKRETFSKVLSKNPDQQKVLRMIALRKLIKQNDPRAALITK